MRVLGLGLPELLIIFVIVLLVFGAGRITKVAGELGSGIRAFQKGLKGDESDDDEMDDQDGADSAM